jgi:hypothetical protein
MKIQVTLSIEKTFTIEDKAIRNILDISNDEDLFTLNSDQIEFLKEYYADPSIIEENPIEVSITQV